MSSERATVEGTSVRIRAVFARFALPPFLEDFLDLVPRAIPFPSFAGRPPRRPLCPTVLGPCRGHGFRPPAALDAASRTLPRSRRVNRTAVRRYGGGREAREPPPRGTDAPGVRQFSAWSTSCFVPVSRSPGSLAAGTEAD
ncbi:hypothetical protein FRAHR75_220026 [Frankia sp. Hr75.2]|nr:hypothetical protein FRAHR75_220026 [Frankia sp. Hr75.2]